VFPVQVGGRSTNFVPVEQAMEIVDAVSGVAIEGNRFCLLPRSRLRQNYKDASLEQVYQGVQEAFKILEKGKQTYEPRMEACIRVMVHDGNKSKYVNIGNSVFLGDKDTRVTFRDLEVRKTHVMECRSLLNEWHRGVEEMAKEYMDYSTKKLSSSVKTLASAQWFPC